MYGPKSSYEQKPMFLFCSGNQVGKKRDVLSSGMQQYENRSQIRNVTDERTDGPTDRH